MFHLCIEIFNSITDSIKTEFIGAYETLQQAEEDGELYKEETYERLYLKAQQEKLRDSDDDEDDEDDEEEIEDDDENKEYDDDIKEFIHANYSVNVTIWEEQN